MWQKKRGNARTRGGPKYSFTYTIRASRYIYLSYVYVQHLHIYTYYVYYAIVSRIFGTFNRFSFVVFFFFSLSCNASSTYFIPLSWTPPLRLAYTYSLDFFFFFFFIIYVSDPFQKISLAKNEGALCCGRQPS